MKRLLLFSAVAGLLLTSPTPLPSSEFTPSEPRRLMSATLAASAAQPAADPLPTLPYEPIELAADLSVPPKLPEPPQLPKAAPPPEEPREDVAVAEAQPASGGGIQVVVSIPQQKAYVFEDGELLATSPVSTGKRGHATPTGTFAILEKKVHHRSNKYANAPMPYMQRLTWSGIAMHAGSLPGYPASHGCIRFPRSFAKKLYNLTDYGTRVTVVNQRPKSAEHALNLA
jgi:lipoprotein-anchoring transpeptidase ErfK/SrfK